MTPQEMAALHARCFTMPGPWSEKDFDEILSAPNSLVLTQANGFIVGQSAAGEAEILTLAVDPETRRQGIGKKLLDRFVSLARASGNERIFLEVAADNAQAIALYETCGFIQTGSRTSYYRAIGQHRIDALILCREIK